MSKNKRILLVSDVHNCHIDWYGVSNAERMERLVKHLQEEYARTPYEMILFLGDYSLDFWEWDELGCYVDHQESRTREFVEKYASRLPAPWTMIAGNHEQYGEAKWHEITGCSRQNAVTVGDWLFILTDSFGKDLDPDFHSDGTFTPIDVPFVRAQMEKYPDHKVVLCSHHFDSRFETEEGKALIRDPRVVCLFAGHVHLSRIVEIEGKKLCWTGNYSYSSEENPLDSMWGFREAILSDDGIVTRYITPENKIILDGQEIIVPYGTQDEIEIRI